MFEHSEVTLRALEARQECEACVTLQREIWGSDFVDVVPATILQVSQRVGGVAAGAFDANHHLVGFVFGISGITDGRLAHWSDMLAVRPEARRCGIGQRLKLYQRARLLDLGIRVAYWTYDPLQARNASFNLNVLGAHPTEYAVHMYGDTRSTLHRGLDTDRLIVVWQLDDPDVERRIAGEQLRSFPDPATDMPIVIPPRRVAAREHEPDRALPTGEWVRIAVPTDLGALMTTAPDEARRWQETVRRAFRAYLRNGYRVVGFCGSTETDPPAYVLTRQSDSEGSTWLSA